MCKGICNYWFNYDDGYHIHFNTDVVNRSKKTIKEIRLSVVNRKYSLDEFCKKGLDKKYIGDPNNEENADPLDDYDYIDYEDYTEGNTEKEVAIPVVVFSGKYEAVTIDLHGKLGKNWSPLYIKGVKLVYTDGSSEVYDVNEEAYVIGSGIWSLR